MATAKKADIKIRSTNFTGDDGKLIYPRAHHDHIDGKPTSYPPTAHTHTIDEIEGLTIPAAQVAVDWNSTSGVTAILNKPSWIGSSKPSYTASEVGARSSTWTPSWSQVSGKPTTFTPSTHPHSVATDTASGFMSNFDKTKLDGIEAGAQKNSDITKEEIEAKLTGSITSHTHNYRPAGDVPWTEVSDKPTWIGTKKPSYNLSEITETTLYKYFTTLNKNKLDGIETGAQVNVGTNLSQGARGTTTLRIDSSTGNNLTLPAVTTSLAGLMTSTDKTRLDVLHSLLEEDTENNVVDSINEVLEIFDNYPEGADLVTALAGKVDKVTGKGLSTNDYTTTEKNKLSGIATGAQKNVATNLSQGARDANSLRIDSSTGNNVTLPAVTDLLAGLMTSTDKTKLDGITTGAQVNRAIATTAQAQTGTNNTSVMTPLRVKESITANARAIDWTPSWSQVSGKPTTFTPSTHPHSVATDTASGFMSNFDKTKLDGIEAGATNLTIGTTASTAKAGNYHPTWSQVSGKPTFATVATSGSYNDLTNKPSIPSIPSVMTTTEGNTGTATTQRTVNAKNLKDIILNHSPAGSRPASDVKAWAKADDKPGYNLGEIEETLIYRKVSQAEKIDWNNKFNTPAGTASQYVRGNGTLAAFPTIPAAQVQSNWNATTGMGVILNKPALKTVATSGSYNDLTNKPSIPSIPSVMTTTEGNTGTATTQRTVNAKNLKDIILNHSPAGERPSTWSNVSGKPTWIGSSKPSYTASEVGARSSTWTPSWSQVTSKPTNIIRQVSFSGGTMVIEVI